MPVVNMSLLSEPLACSPVEYRDVARWPGYRVGSDGSVWSCKSKGRRSVPTDSWHPLKTSIHSAGYLVVTFRCGRSVKVTMYVHRLVLEAFIGPCPEGKECRHKDGNRKNASLSNLEWGTPTQNAADKLRHGTEPFGSRRYNAKLTEADVETVLRLRESGMTYRAIAERFDVATTTIKGIFNGHSWKRHICGLRAVGLLGD